MSYKILIIEDELETSKYLSKALKEEGFFVECAENGTIGIDMLKANKFDLIVLDLKMPGKSGDEVLQEIRTIDPLISVVVYTNYTETPVMQKLMNLGVDGFLKKGASADLWGTVEFIKSKFNPLDEEKRRELFDGLFKSIQNTNEDEIPS